MTTRRHLNGLAVIAVSGIVFSQSQAFCQIRKLRYSANAGIGVRATSHCDFQGMLWCDLAARLQNAGKSGLVRAV